MSIDPISAIGAVAAGLSVINMLWLWHQASRAPTETALANVATDVDKLDSRVQSLESEIKHLPTKDEIHSLRLQLSDVIGQLRTSESEMAGVLRTLRRLEDHLRGVGA